jgi:hypothetical protein
MTSNLCEALVCGTSEQAMFLIELPSTFRYGYYSDLFRACVSRHVLLLGLYRAPQHSESSYMPFVYTCPPPKTILNVSDSIYVYGSPKDVQSLEKILNMAFLKQGNMTYLGELSLSPIVLLYSLSLCPSHSLSLAFALGSCG